MDPLTAVSLAGTICQLVDFSSKLISSANTIYSDSSGATKETVTLKLVTADLKNLNDEVLKYKNFLSNTTQDDRQLINLAEQCNHETEELQNILNKLTASNEASRWESFRKAFRGLMSKSKIEEHERRLSRMQKQIDTRLIRMMSSQHSTTFSWFKELSYEHRRIQLESANRIEKLQYEVSECVKRQSLQTDRLYTLTSTLQELIQEGSRVASESMTLKSLEFREWRRQFQHKAHKQTFNWIFESSRNTEVSPTSSPSPPNFVDWLERGDGIYWISGKAGAGKSTLMKFLSDHNTVKHHLEAWSGPNAEPVVITWFFWSAGSPIQRSQEGLLRSILYQILKRCPHLVPKVCAHRQEWYMSRGFSSGDSPGPWELEELSAAVDILTKEDIKGLRFCLFIDGLDEYDGPPIELIKVLKNLSLSTSIKLCISSRPWNEFLDAFDETKRDGGISLELYTKQDIEVYVRDILATNEVFLAAEKVDKRCGKFVQLVIDRAQGVFLWVQLVVSRLLRACAQQGWLDDLERRLDAMPKTLEEFFGRMLDQIDPEDWLESSKIFLLTMHAVQPLSVTAYHFFREEEKEPGFSLNRPIEPIVQTELEDIRKNMKTRLNFLCKDLIEVNKVSLDDARFTDYTVGFIHRTAKDFLLSNDIRTKLMRRATKDHIVSWDPYQALCTVTLAMAKSLSLPKGIQPGINTVFNVVDELMFYAFEIEVQKNIPNVDILDELDRAITYYSKQDMVCHWTNARDIPLDDYFEENNQNSFLALAIQSRLSLYVAQKLDKKPALITSKKGRPLLDYALRPIIITPIELPQFKETIDFDMAQLLLDRGADPNQRISIYDDITVWALFLLTCYFGHRSGKVDTELKGTWFQAATMMIRKGANRELKLETTSLGSRVFREGNESDGIIVKTAKYKTSLYRNRAHSFVIPTQLTAKEIMLQTFGESRTEELNAIWAEFRIGSLWSKMTSWTW